MISYHSLEPQMPTWRKMLGLQLSAVFLPAERKFQKYNMPNLDREFQETS